MREGEEKVWEEKRRKGIEGTGREGETKNVLPIPNKLSPPMHRQRHSRTARMPLLSCNARMVGDAVASYSRRPTLTLSLAVPGPKYAFIHSYISTARSTDMSHDNIVFM